MSHRKTTTRDRECRPLCKVCKDAGKSEQVFTSHFTKNRDGKVTCPTLLAIKCRRCSKAGHTASYCTVSMQEEVKKPEEQKQKPIILCPRVNEVASMELKTMLSIPKHPMKNARRVTFEQLLESSVRPEPKKKTTIYVDNWADVEDSDDEFEYEWRPKSKTTKNKLDV
jgi:hypothetical protein